MCQNLAHCFFTFFILLSVGSSQAFGQVYFLRDTFCSNQILIVNNHLYSIDNPTGTEILPGAAVNGADSIIEVRLVFFQPAVVLLDQVLCGADTLWVNNVPYHAGFTIGQEVIEGGAANGCDSIIQIQLTAGLAPQVDIVDTLCPGAFITVNGRRYDQDNPSGFEIFPGATALGCDSVLHIDLFFSDHTLSLGEDLTIESGDTVCIAPALNFIPSSLVWSTPLPCNTLDCFPVCQPFNSSTNLGLMAIDSAGCVFDDNLVITVVKATPIYAPTVFSPNAGFPNNRFFISAKDGITVFKTFQITNRWGELVFRQENLMPDNPAQGWDGIWNGKQAPPGVYVFWTEATWADGTSEVFSGSFMLFR